MSILMTTAGVLAAFMSLLFVVAARLANNGVADVGYGVAFMVAIAATALQVGPLTPAQMLIAILPFIWGIRLALRIGRKNLNKPEDFRYAAWRRDWGSTVLARSFLQIYMLQGAVVFLVALPVLLVLVYPTGAGIGALTVAGVVAWVVGFVFQTVGDAQLDAFVADKSNRGKIMMGGLWTYSRHPNYFGESLMWWGIAIAAIPATTLPALGFVSPILITGLLLFVSGVPLLEARWETKPGWADYKRRTSVFIPMPPGA